MAILVSQYTHPLAVPRGSRLSVPGEKIFYVDSVNGASGNNGRSWGEAVNTLQAGINLARYLPNTTTIDSTKDHRAYVLVAPGHYNEAIAFSGYNISIIGMGIDVPGKDYGVSINYDGSTATNAGIAFSGSGLELINLHVQMTEALPGIWCAGGDNNFIKNCVVECDGTNATYGIHMASMKGSRIEDVVIHRAKTAGIYVAGGADKYFIEAAIRRAQIYSDYSNTKGIYVDSHATLVCYNAVIADCEVILSSGSSCKGIDVDNNAGPIVRNCYVSVPSSATPIEHAGGDQFLLGNHTAAGTTNVDPNPAAG